MDSQMFREDGDVIRFVDTRTIDGHVFVVDQIEYLDTSGELGEFARVVGEVYERLADRDEWTSLLLDGDEPGTFVLGLRLPTAIETEYMEWKAQQPVHPMNWGFGASVGVTTNGDGSLQIGPLTFAPVQHEEGLDAGPGSE